MLEFSVVYRFVFNTNYTTFLPLFFARIAPNSAQDSETDSQIFVFVKIKVWFQFGTKKAYKILQTLPLTAVYSSATVGNRVGLQKKINSPQENHHAESHSSYRYALHDRRELRRFQHLNPKISSSLRRGWSSYADVRSWHSMRSRNHRCPEVTNRGNL